MTQAIGIEVGKRSLKLVGVVSSEAYKVFIKICYRTTEVTANGEEADPALRHV